MATERPADPNGVWYIVVAMRGTITLGTEAGAVVRREVAVVRGIDFIGTGVLVVTTRTMAQAPAPSTVGSKSRLTRQEVEERLGGTRLVVG